MTNPDSSAQGRAFDFGEATVFKLVRNISGQSNMIGLGLPLQQYSQLPAARSATRAGANSSSAGMDSSAFVFSMFNGRADTFEAHHLVRGQQRKGFVIDPAAASGICGTDTLLQHNDKVTQICSITPSVAAQVVEMLMH